MRTVSIIIKSCRKCPYLYKSDDYSSDSWDRAENWFCKLAFDYNKESDYKKIKSCVGSWDKVEIPDWCPLIFADLESLDEFQD